MAEQRFIHVLDTPRIDQVNFLKRVTFAYMLTPEEPIEVIPVAYIAEAPAQTADYPSHSDQLHDSNVREVLGILDPYCRLGKDESVQLYHKRLNMRAVLSTVRLSRAMDEATKKVTHGLQQLIEKSPPDLTFMHMRALKAPRAH